MSAELPAELLDDFYAECDESLGSLRVDLTVIEQALASGAGNPVALESLFRHMHSLKGNAAIVGLRDAEGLAHGAENYLRALSRGSALLSQPGLLLLASATQRLEQVIGAHRAHQPAPTTEDLLTRLNAIAVGGSDLPAAAFVSPGAAAEAGAAAGRLASARARGLSLWRCTFAPSAELNARGMNVDAIRARLKAAGEIIRSAPRIGGGAIAFEFDVALAAPPEDPAQWGADGMKLEPLPFPPEGAADPLSPAENSGLFIAPSHIVRVNLDRLDDLMRITGELVIHRSRLDERINRTGRTGAEELQEVNISLGRSLRELRAAITRVRMVSVAEIFSRMPFAVRDLAREQGKEVRLVLEGQQTEIDKYLVERLKEPLLHLIRNAVAHGIEPPAARLAAGKPAAATIILRAATAGASVLIHIRDDGQGIDPAAIAARAAALGLAVPEALDEPAILRLICSSGFSTRNEADRAAGRGVGMAVVQSTVAELGGHLSLQSEIGQFTQFTLRLPLTLSITETLIVSADRQICAVPQSSVSEIVQVAEDQVRTIERVEVVPYRDGLLPIVRLRRVFGAEASAAPKTTILVLDSDRGLSGLAVDRVHGQREVVIRALRDPLVQVPGISGATELGDGRPVLILDAAALTLALFSIPETYILFELGDTVYGINSRDVLHIEMLEHIAPVPHTAPAVDGVVFSRGQVVPALNLRTRFGLPPQARDLRTRLIFIRFHERTVALIVDAAREFRKFPAEAVRATDGALHGIAGNYVSGVATLNERTVLILDLTVVLDLETALPALLDAAVAGAPAAS